MIQHQLPPINYKKIISLPDYVLRKAAIDIQNGDACKLLLNNRMNDIRLLNSTIILKDSILKELSFLRKDDSAMIIAYRNNEITTDAENAQLKKQYSYLKFNDRLKVGIFGTILIGITYAWITKK